MAIDFTILAHGAVGVAEIVASDVDSEEVVDCILARVRRWNLGPVITDPTSTENVQTDVQDSVATSAPALVPSTSARAFVTSSIRFDEAELP